MGPGCPRTRISLPMSLCCKIMVILFAVFRTSLLCCPVASMRRGERRARLSTLQMLGQTMRSSQADLAINAAVWRRIQQILAARNLTRVHAGATHAKRIRRMAHVKYLLSLAFPDGPDEIAPRAS